MTDLAAAVQRVLPGVRSDLEDLVAIESVWADPARRPEVHRSADAVARLFRDAGFPEVDVVEEGGGPAVIAHRPGPEGAPTVLLYAHHDVQPEGDHDAWTSPPFTVTERDGRLFARGAADDKAGVAAHLAAVRAFDGEPPVGVTVFVEGEEESGSPTIRALLERHRDRLAADVIVIADAANWDIGVPSLTTSLRGLVDCEVEVRTLSHAVHSGMWGGVAHDALTALCRLLATLHDEHGDVAIAGLPTIDVAELEYPTERLRAESGLLDGVDELGTGSVVQRLWGKPAVAVIGLDATPTAKVSNTLVPRAKATVSLRIPPGADPHTSMDALVAHLESHAPWGARVEVTRGETGEAFSVDADGPAYDAARAAFREAWDGTDPVDIGAGGSIPFIGEFAAVFPDAKILVTGVEDPDTRAHGIDESLHLAEFERVCLAEALLLRNLAEIPRS